MRKLLQEKMVLSADPAISSSASSLKTPTGWEPSSSLRGRAGAPGFARAQPEGKKRVQRLRLREGLLINERRSVHRRFVKKGKSQDYAKTRPG